MKSDCAGVKLTNEMDRCVWTLTKTVKFTVKSVYGAIKARQVPCPFRKLRFIWIPLYLEVEVFLWLVSRKSRMICYIEDGWVVRGCMFCSQLDEGIDHLFLTFPVVRRVWYVVKCALPAV